MGSVLQIFQITVYMPSIFHFHQHLSSVEEICLSPSTCGPHNRLTKSLRLSGPADADTGSLFFIEEGDKEDKEARAPVLTELPPTLR